MSDTRKLIEEARAKGATWPYVYPLCAALERALEEKDAQVEKTIIWEQGCMTANRRAEAAEAEVERLKQDRDRFQEIVHAVSPVLDPSALGKDAEGFGAATRHLLADVERLKNEVAYLRGQLKSVKEGR